MSSQFDLYKGFWSGPGEKRNESQNPTARRPRSTITQTCLPNPNTLQINSIQFRFWIGIAVQMEGLQGIALGISDGLATIIDELTGFPTPEEHSVTCRLRCRANWSCGFLFEVKGWLFYFISFFFKLKAEPPLESTLAWNYYDRRLLTWCNVILSIVI